jgi:hypothetical protein
MRVVIPRAIRPSPDMRKIMDGRHAVAIAVRGPDGWRLCSADGTVLGERAWPRPQDCALEYEVMCAMGLMPARD